MMLKSLGCLALLAILMVGCDGSKRPCNKIETSLKVAVKAVH